MSDTETGTTISLTALVDAWLELEETYSSDPAADTGPADTPPEAIANQKRIIERLNEMQHAIAQTKAFTPADLQAKARAVLASVEYRESYEGDKPPADNLIGSLCLDILNTAPSPDAELIALCAKHDALQRAYAALNERAVDDDLAERLAGPIIAEQFAILPQLVDIRATTPDGWRARAVTLALESPHLLEAKVGKEGCDDAMLAALLRDMTAEIRR